ncbi:MAG: hypothetical protein JWQ90_3613 [Hydrocarboniphaga sp.]|uniref:efflux RND transporter permease subunit n=1 Tax=Hydrocarboniphaga sp. TaxID=2033016 RepID=UPI00260EF4F9|nr:MMPL family transporter [Hydrocarboniphaga sp.]MDB5971163.1 hypothetical protein [Hydrocarboniphaga sp.]
MSVASTSNQDAMARTIEDFDPRSGNLLERIIFNYRKMLIAVFALLTVLLAWNASKLEVNASFSQMIPKSHPYIRNYLENAASLRGLGNSIRIVVENRRGDVYDAQYLETLRKINDAVFLMKGVDRSYMKSLWTPVVRWSEINEQGTLSGPVMPDRYDGSESAIAQLRENVARAGIVGSIVSNDLHSSIIFVPLLDRDPATDKPLDYVELSHNLERQVRSLQSDTIGIHMVGFAKLVGDLIDGLWQVIGYFAIAAAIAAIIIYLFTRCLRSTTVILSCSIIAVVWQLGTIRLLGYVINPYSVLVPFLVFAIGVSHGAQKMNGVMQDVGRGTHRYVAARYTFRRLFLAGVTALIADAVGFAVLMVIDIPVIRELAVSASIGVTVLIFTNLVLLPVVLSYIGVSPAAARRSLSSEKAGGAVKGTARAYAALARCTERAWAIPVLVVSAAITLAGAMLSLELKVGDLDPGAPELRANSRYNVDNAFVSSHFGLSSDQFAVIVKSPSPGVASYHTMLEMDRFEQELRNLPAVQTTASAAGLLRRYTAATFEGNPKWMTINRSQFVLGDALNNVLVGNPELVNTEYSVAPLVVYLKDHKAETLSQVVRASEAFAKAHDTKDLKFLLAAGNSGIEAATNIVVQQASREMLLLVYAAVVLLCLITFRSWRATLVAVIPLVMTSVLCEALMVILGIGVKVATLPVTALGVGIGVDYALYLLSIQLMHQRSGVPLKESYALSVHFTGRIVALVGITLAAGVAIWAMSPIKFQADMGILLAFMFLWNMVGALVLIPALSHFLLQKSSVRWAESTGAEVLV